MSIHIKVFSLCNEINLNKVAAHFGIPKKFKWEESLTLNSEQLKGVIKEPKDKQVKLFYFGSGVFVNMAHHEIMDVVNYLKEVEKGITATSFKYQDDYSIMISQETPSIHFDYMNINRYEDFHLNILSVVLAKSVALEKIEEGLDSVLDEMEDVINMLEKGRLAISDSRLAKTAGNILKHKFNTISYVMLLDKPDITWINEESEVLYDKLSKLFELRDRYEKIKAKSETLMDIAEVFTTLTHQKRGNILEWMVIILIAIELVVALVERL